MAKTLGQLRAKTLKLKELEPPHDASPATKNFVKKHVYVVHPDANENGDDVFKATNVKRAKRFPDHGYENGQDKDVYESGYSDVAIMAAEKHLKTATQLSRYADAIEKKDPGKAIAHRILAKKHLKKAATYAPGVVKAAVNESTGLATLFAVRALRKAMTSSATRGRFPQVRKAKHQEHNPPPKVKKKNGKPVPQDTTGYWDQKEETNLDEIMVPSMPAIYSALSRSSRTARNPSARRPAPKDNGYWKGTLDLTPDMQDPAQKKELENHPLHRKIANMADPDYRRLAAKRKVREEAEMEGYEHIAVLSEKDQALLVDTYNSLTEENQDRFLEIAETEEGVDTLLDFAITNKRAE